MSVEEISLHAIDDGAPVIGDHRTWIAPNFPEAMSCETPYQEMAILLDPDVNRRIGWELSNFVATGASRDKARDPGFLRVGPPPAPVDERIF